MEYLIQHGANIKKEDLFFRNAFDRLCAVPPNSNSVKAAKLLIKSGCTQRLMCSDKLPNTSLMLATINGNRELVKFLIEEGADYSAKTSHGLTAVDMAMTSSKLIYDYFKSLK